MNGTAGGALRIRNYGVFLGGQTVSNIGTWFQSLAQSLLVLRLTGSGADLGAVTALQFAPLLVLGSLGGAVADRRDCRRVLICTSTASGGIAAVLAAVTFAGHGSVGALLLAAMSLGVVQAFDRPAAQAFISQLVPSHQVARGVSLFTVSVSAARLIGPAVGGLLYATAGPAGCFLINSASFFLALASILVIRRGSLSAPAFRPGAAVGMFSGYRHAWQDRELRMALTANAFVGLLAFNFGTTITALVGLTLHGSPVDVGLGHAANAVGAVAGGVAAARYARVGARHVAWWCAALGIAMAAVAPVGGVTVFLALAPLLGLAIGGYQAVVASFVQLRSAPHVLARMLGLLAMGSMGTTAIGAVLVGWLIEVQGARAAFLLGAGSCLVAALALLSTSRNLASASEPGRLLSAGQDRSASRRIAPWPRDRCES